MILLRMECEVGHESTLELRGYTRVEAEVYAGILDGTAAIYKYPPREYPIKGSRIGRCEWRGSGAQESCGAWFRAEVISDEPEP